MLHRARPVLRHTGVSQRDSHGSRSGWRAKGHSTRLVGWPGRNAKTPGSFDALGNANAWSAAGHERRRFSVVDNGNGPVKQVCSVVMGPNAQRLTELARTIGQVGVGASHTPSTHRAETFGGLDGTDQDRLSASDRTCHDVDALVDAVAEVDVEMPGRAEHHRVARRFSVERMARRIIRHIGLDLNDPAAAHDSGDIDGQAFPKQVWRDLGRVTLEPRSVDRLRQARHSVDRSEVSDCGDLIGEHGAI